MRPAEVEKLLREKERLSNVQKSEKEAAADKKRAAERKLAELQAREEEQMRSLVAARGRDGRRANRRGAGREYVGRGGGPRGGRPGGDARRGAPSNVPNEEDLQLNGGPPKDGQADLATYKVCQFFLHEFKTSQPKVQKLPGRTVNDNADVIAEIEQAFCGFFESSECDMAYKDHNLDACEAAYQLACDAEENRYKLTLPLEKSVLLCESLITHEASGKKGSSDFDVQVAEDSILAPTSLYQGKWILNGDNLAYHQNIMQEGTVIQIFSTDDEE